MIRQAILAAGLCVSACGPNQAPKDVSSASPAVGTQTPGDLKRTAAPVPSSSAPRVALLVLGTKGIPTATSSIAPEELIRARLSELGRVDGKTIRIEDRYANGELQRLDSLAREVVDSKPDVIITVAAAATLAAHRATTTIPIVMAHAGDPVGAGVAVTLARPGGNVTGTTSMVPDLGAKQVEILRQVVPRMKKLGVLMNQLNPGHLTQLANLKETARLADIEVVVAEVMRSEDIDGALAALHSARLNAVFVMVEPMIYQNRSQLLEFIKTERLPASFDVGRAFVREGGLISYGPVLTTHYALVAEYVEQILKGANPGELPIQQPTQFALVVNLKTASALGLAIPRSLLLRADELIE